MLTSYPNKSSGTHIADIVAQPKAGRKRTQIKGMIREKLAPSRPNEEGILENAVKLVTSLRPMIRCGTFPCGFSGRTEFLWVQRSLRERVAHHFASPPIPSHENIKPQKNFDAVMISGIAGVSIKWADNLITCDHHRRSDNGTKVHIFHYAGLLE
ncbi:hypothetical protein KVR01_003249 [Diaporthe batatas]|uniref:uncharacterized protein n=1 Tax=Diaporthe batatas TaxID=748121 RepID=UPI001D0466E4|nr:uncharacterized protein KVR01_003249 [Diaporthe batatas]KAG8167560.1 hypothetical protein KVR01_003249 [Diaporthe batatas]